MVNVELPDSWEKVNLGNALSYIGNGLTDKQNKVNDGYPVTRIETISDDCINADKVGYISTLPEDKIEKYRLCYGDMLVSHINSDPQLGRSVVYEGNPEFLLHGMNLLRMRANTKVLAPFFLNLIFRFYRNRGVFIALASRAVGQSSINQSRMQSLIIPLPSLPEQRAIAHVLQTIQEAKATRQRELALERERKAELMDHLFSYGTKGEPRKQTEIGEIPESWDVVELNKVCSKIVDCPHSTPKFLESGVLCARNFNIRSGIYVREPASYTSEAEYLERIKRLIPQEGDVLFSREAPIGEACLLPPDTRLSLGQRMMLLRVNPSMLDDYFLVQSFYVTPLRSKMLSLGRGATAKHLNVGDVKCLEMLIPSLNEQQKISEILRACDTKVATLEREAERLDELFHTMLDELMTGQRSALPLIDAELPHSSGIMEGKRLEGVSSEDSPKTETCLRSL